MISTTTYLLGILEDTYANIQNTLHLFVMER